MTRNGGIWKRPPTTWAERLAERVAGAVRSLRGSSRSAQEIADETERLGYRVSRSQIANLESGRKRSLDIAELLILAAALKTSPVTLMYPNPSDEMSQTIEVLPGVETTEFRAAQWFSGHRHVHTDIADAEKSGHLVGEFRDNTQLLNDWRRLRELELRQSDIRGEITAEKRQLIEQYESQMAPLREKLRQTDA